MNRAEHMQWCKDRALAALEESPQSAFSSMASDLQQHPETANHIGIQLGMMQLIGGMLVTPESMRKYIEGFN